jgi:hypothetical protein
MRLIIKLILGSVIALTLGLASSSPILIQNLALTNKIQVEVDVVYAYFGVQNFDQNITGLSRNLTGGPYIISYFFVLNVTNRSNKLAMIEKFEVSAAPEILVYNGTEMLGSKKLAEHATTSPITNETFGVLEENTIITDLRDLSEFYPAWSQFWSPNKSRLIALTGMVEVSSLAYPALTNGTIYLYGEAKGKPYEGGTLSRGFSLKQVQLQIVGQEFLYNSLLSENQLLRFGGNNIDVYVETRS